MFLQPHEARIIYNDYKRMVLSAESADVKILYKIPINPVVDPVYGTITADSWDDKTVKAKAIQKMIGLTDEEILRWGILKQGDCIFYFLSDLDLSQVNESSILTAVNVDWIPVPRDLKQFWNYVQQRLGNHQVGQAVPCRLRQ